MTDGSGRVCEACGETFRTLTKLRIHEKDDCPQRETFTKLDPNSGDVGWDAAGQLLTCRSCDREFPDIQYEQRTSFADGDFHIIVEFGCPNCGFDNENRVVGTGVSRDSIDDLPEHLQPDDEEISTDGGIDVPICDTEGCDTECPGLEDGWEQSDGTLRCVDCWDTWKATGEWPEGGDE